MKSKQIGMCVLVGMLMISMFGQMMAYQVESSDQPADTSNYPSDNWFSRLISKLKFNIFQSGTFTVYGDELGCEKYPSETTEFINKLIGSSSITITAGSGESMFINWFRGSPSNGEYPTHLNDNRQFMDEIYLENGESITLTCDASAYWEKRCYYDIYQCPSPCYSNSDCSSNEYCEKTIVSQAIPDAGVCKDLETGNPTHETSVYRCENGVKNSLGKVLYGSENFCNSQDDAKYLIGSTDQCLDYEPEICYQVPTGDGGTTIGTDNLARQKGLTKEEIRVSTTQSILASVCTESDQCESGSQCNSLQVLVENNVVSDIQAKDIVDATKGTLTSFGAGITGTVVCSAVLGGLSAGTLIPVCLAVGLGTGIGFDSMFKNLAEGKLEKTGVCVKSGGLEQYTGWAAFFPITGDKGTDGLIIIFAMILMLGVIFKK